MAKQAISVTLDTTNLTWLKARVAAHGARSVSQLLDRLVADARSNGSAHPATSVVGTIDIDSSDPMLLQADAALQAVYQASLRRPLPVKEARSSYAQLRRRERPGRG